jgi:Actinobacteria/chloroflexi VLRF1 release factor
VSGHGRRIDVPAERLDGWVERFADRHGPLRSSGTPTEVRLDAADGSWARLTVPWPPLDDGDPLPALVLQAVRPRRIAVLLVRRGGYAVGVLDPAGFTVTKVGSRHVQGRTKAGGWSQQRYARRRAQQARGAFAAASDAVAQVLLPVAETLDGLVTGGDRRAVAEVLADPRLTPLADLPVGRFLAVPDPRRAVLEKAAQACRAVEVEVMDVTRAAGS